MSEDLHLVLCRSYWSWVEGQNDMQLCSVHEDSNSKQEITQLCREEIETVRPGQGRQLVDEVDKTIAL